MQTLSPTAKKIGFAASGLLMLLTGAGSCATPTTAGSTGRKDAGSPVESAAEVSAERAFGDVYADDKRNNEHNKKTYGDVFVCISLSPNPDYCALSKRYHIERKAEGDKTCVYIDARADGLPPDGIPEAAFCKTEETVCEYYYRTPDRNLEAVTNCGPR